MPGLTVSKNKMQNDIQLFDSKYIPQIVDRVKPMWSVPSWSDEFKQFDVEFIVRSTIYENDLSFQLAESECLLSVALAVTKSEKNNVDQWFLENSRNLSEQEKISAKMSFDYIKYMDSKVFALMNDDDIKLSLFVSCKKGSGSVVFEHLWKLVKNRGYKNMYLWTDCDCNWQWYLNNGFILIEESEYGPFSEENNPYKTYLFKKEIL